MLTGAIFAQQNQWTKVSKRGIKDVKSTSVQVSDFELLRLNTDELKKQLFRVPGRAKNISAKGILMKFPNDMGTFDTYEVYEASTMHPDLQSRYSGTRSYIGNKVGDPTTQIRFSIDPYFGLNAVIRSRKGIYYIDPYSGDNRIYRLYNRGKAQPTNQFECLFQENENLKQLESDFLQGRTVTDGLLRRYRLAVSTTVEYTEFTARQAGISSGTEAEKKAAVLAAVNLILARINGIFENDLSITLQLIPNTDALFFVNSDTFDPGSAEQMIDENINVTNSIIGSNSYDIGHLFFRSSPNNDSGLAYTPSVCDNNFKAGAVTGSSNPVGDPFAVDFVAHELGHQFGANHTQNNICGRNVPTSVEPGSGSTIMAYAGICAPNVQNRSDAYFHAVSIREIYTTITSPERNCSANTPTGNNEPTVNAGPDRTIPRSTPFVLTGEANDPDGDPITYNWEQVDFGVAPMPPRSTNTVGPMFRSTLATTSPSRYFPRLSTVIQGYDPNINTPSDYRAWEKLSSVARTLNFSLLVRDNNPAGGQSGRDDLQLTVSDSAGPFIVTSQNTSGVVWNVGEPRTITWDVAGTSAAPVNTTNVTILLSTDGGLTFPHTLVASTSNNGSYTFNVPNGLGETSSARLMVRAIDNVFFNVNTTNFTIHSNSTVDETEPSELIYPNPSRGVFIIEADVKQGMSYTIFAMDGKLVKPRRSINVSGKIFEEVDLSEFPSGVYMLLIERDGQRTTKKIIITK